MWRGTGITHAGRVRQTNQDAFAVEDRLRLWVVADGMGGRAGGDIASQVAVKTIVGCFQPSAENAEQTIEAASTALRRAIEAGDMAIRTETDAHPDLKGMGTTIVALVLSQASQEKAIVAHVGDSRAYLLRAKRLTPLTEDHSLVEDYLRQGLISRADALIHPQRHIVTRALGIEGQAEPESSVHLIERDDIFLLCTDGLTKMLEDDEILETILASGKSAEAACSSLVTAANERGGSDNITVLIVRDEQAA